MAPNPAETGLATTQDLLGYIANLLASSSPLETDYKLDDIAHTFIANHGPDTLHVFRHNGLFRLVRDITSAAESSGISEASSVTILIKGKGQLASLSPLDAQLNVLNIPTGTALLGENSDGNPSNAAFENLRALINLGIGPYFDLVSADSSRNESSSLNTTRKKFNELSLSLQHLQQRIQVPDLLISTHPKIRTLASSDIPDALLEDTSFLNELTSVVNTWIRQIQSITHLNHNPTDGTSINDDILFWRSMELALIAIEQQIDSPDVKTSIDILNKAKRFHITLSFQNDIGLNEKMGQTKMYNSMLKELPIDDFIVTNSQTHDSFHKFELYVIGVFNHLNRLKNLNAFPLSRAIEMIEVVLNDIVTRFSQLLATYSIMSLPFDAFLDLYQKYFVKVFTTIDNNIKFKVNLIRELLRKRQEKFIIIKINQDSFKNLRERIEHLKAFRLKHDELLLTVNHLLGPHAASSAEELIEAYGKYVLPVNVLDLSQHALLIWSNNEKSYLSVYSKLESAIISKLNGVFRSCSDFNEYISVYNKLQSFNKLQNDGVMVLLTLIDDEIKLKILARAHEEISNFISLNIALSNQATENTFSIMTRYSDPAISKIAWNLGLCNKLSAYTKNLYNLLGANWNKYSLGSKIELEVDGILASLNPQQLFDKWWSEISDLSTENSSKIIFTGAILQVHQDTNNELSLKVNFDAKLLSISSHINQLTSLGFNIPATVQFQFLKIHRIRPFILTLQEHIDILQNIFSVELVDTDYGRNFGFLLDTQKQIILLTLKNVIDIDWIFVSQAFETDASNDDSETKENYVETKSLDSFTNFQSEIYKLYVQVNKISKFHELLQSKLKELEECDYSFKAIEKVVSSVQHEMVFFSYGNYSNFSRFCDKVNDNLEQVLIAKCQKQLSSLHQQFAEPKEELDEDEETETLTSCFLPTAKHSIFFENQLFVISPPLEETKKTWFSHLNDLLNIIELQSKVLIDIGAGHFEVKRDESIRLPLCQLLQKFDRFVQQGTDYFLRWSVLQNLWELNLNDELDLKRLFGGRISDDVSAVSTWLSVFRQVLDLRLTFETSETFSTANEVLVISSSKVQSRANIKFDNFQNELVAKFARVHQGHVMHFNKSITNSNSVLEPALSLQADIGTFLSSIGDFVKAKGRHDQRIQDLELLKASQTLLTRQRYKFPADWLFVEQLENNFAILISLMERKDATINGNMDLIASKLTSEAKNINDSTKKLVNEWSTKKPIAGNLNPSRSIQILNNFQEDFDNLEKRRKLALEISDHLELSLDIDDGVLFLSDEVGDLKSVWSAINTLWEELERIKHLKWAEIQHRTLRRHMDDLLTASRSQPTKIRQYAAFDEIQGLIKSYLKNFSYVSDLKSDAMKPRHWRTMFSQLGMDDIPAEKMTVGTVFNLNFQLNDTVIKSILAQANNEQTIEENLNVIKKDWSSITLETFNYEGKCRLIKNWDKIFDQCNNNIASLASMKSSTYFGNFEQDVLALEDKLNKLFVLLDSWIDVQRQWVYLDGVFGSDNSDVKHLLPLESSRFTNITFEFFSLLKYIHKQELVIDILMVPEVQPTMEKFLESLVKVRKSLTDYLEKQRHLFPRFYFIGNEDLLEIIGGASDITRINKHLKKMFSGVSSIDIDTESSCITAINSDQGEKVSLASPVSLIKYPKLHEWLGELETEIKLSLSALTGEYLNKFREIFAQQIEPTTLGGTIKVGPSQVVTLALQILFTTNVESSIVLGNLKETLSQCNDLMQKLSTLIASEGLSVLERKKTESVIIEVLHQRDIVLSLLSVESTKELKAIWRLQQQYHYDEKTEPLTNLTVKHATASFVYGYEYLGVPEKLAFTPLVDKCFLAMTQALDQKLGGSPFGPAGTGKTESVKALGNNLGKMVIVFCCDELFDFQSMSRIFLGLCKVGCYGCFDEFNRLDENILSAVSSQIEAIEIGLKDSEQVDISGRLLKVNPETGIFVTMNPGYVGRYELPENLKKLFRGFSMQKPDKEIISEVILTSQGFTHSRELSSRIVPFFSEIEALASKQSHYDFGLRTLKSTLSKCGSIKRSMTTNISSLSDETRLLVRSIRETIAPKLVKQDEVVLEEVQEKHFKGIIYDSTDYSEVVNELQNIGAVKGLDITENWTAKALQLVQIQESHHGIMLVGDAGSGKSTIYKLVLEAMSSVENVDHLSFVIDCKVMSKEALYGSLDTVTRDWTDGLLTSILRRIMANLRGELSKRIWIVFDGDLDPEWAENLNSVLDDNKILTLPNGERLELPPNVRLLFEVDSLEFTTLATISRCGMVWFDDSLVGLGSIIGSFLYSLKTTGITEHENELEMLTLQGQLHDNIEDLVSPEFLETVASKAESIHHIMEFSAKRVSECFFVLLKNYCQRYVEYALANSVPIDTKKYLQKTILLAATWAFAGDSSLESREEFGKQLVSMDVFQGIETAGPIIDYDISLPDCLFTHWNSQVAINDLEPHQVSNPSTVVPTLDTVRNERLVYSVLNAHKPVILCGPPGSGKTLTLLEALRKLEHLDVLSLNFSKDTSSKSLMTSLEQHCHYKKTSKGLILGPKVQSKWVVVFCDEINLPGPDKYGTQKVISLLRQMVEANGFWKNGQWVSLFHVQFVGACNSPTDPGRHPLASRFLRHNYVIMVDYPGESSLKQIYQTFTAAILKCAPNLRGFSKDITKAMIEIYAASKKTLKLQEHYVYSPRELTRWSRGILEALKQNDYNDLQSLVRIWYHEGLRLFYDRIVDQADRVWTKDLFKNIVEQTFLNINVEKCLQEPVLYSSWLTPRYEPADEQELRAFVKERLRVFSDEELAVDLVLHEDFLDHALRIDRVLRQPQGHMILVGPCTSGKSTLTRFIAWINGLKCVTLRVHAKYGLAEFEAALRGVLVRCTKGEKICFVIDESSIKETSFIERMNTLLANAEIPGLFEGEEERSLLNLCADQSQSQGLLLEEDELYDWFRNQVLRHLHVVFTISELAGAVVSSPALFNRCVLSWMGDWLRKTLEEIGHSVVDSVPMDTSNYKSETFGSLRDAVVEGVIAFHTSPIAEETVSRTPSQFMALCLHFSAIYVRKQVELEENQRHIITGLDKLRETVIHVNELKKKLSEKKEFLTTKEREARAMLSKMLTDQNEAERKQEFSVATQEELTKQLGELERRKTLVLKDLELAEPAVLNAQRGVQNIKKQHLTEIRSMYNPPATVKMTMELVCILIGYDVSSWKDVQLVVRKDDFITNIVSYDNSQLTPEVRQHMEQVYLSRSDYNVESANRASKACGPLLQWVQAQMQYSLVLERIGPLRQEVHLLEAQTNKTRAQLIAIDEMIKELEESIEKYKDGYSSLIREAENIKTEMKTVETKVDRSLQLVENLTSERERWKVSIQKFGQQKERLVGNALLSAAFLVYAGEHDQRNRDILLKNWKAKLESSNIAYEEALAISSYMATSNGIWDLKNLGLSDLHVDNFTIMRGAQVPLIIDPSSSVLGALETTLTKKVISTSFLNSDFVRHVENALRFGGHLIIHDAEYYDPILDPILRREVVRNGGRMIVQLGSQEVDYSPDFKLVLYTKDQLISAPAFVSARTTVVNFTITSGSLANQVLNTTLQRTRPDVQEKRDALLALQGEYQVRLHTLEEELLSSLSASFGNILESDEVIDTLETLKAEANDIDSKIGESHEVITAVDDIRNKYDDLAKHSVAIFRIFQALNVGRFNNFSLKTYISVFEDVLRLKDASFEVSGFITELYKEVFATVAPGLSFFERSVMALALVAVYNEIEIGPQFTTAISAVLKGVETDSPALKTVLDHSLAKYLEPLDIEKVIAENTDNPTISILSDVLRALTSTQKDAALDGFTSLASFLFAGVGPYSSKYDLKHWTESFTSIILASPDGYDATFKVEQLAKQMSEKLVVVSMGSKEGIEMANKEIDLAISKGTWILIQNIQMATSWLSELLKKVESVGKSTVRVFLTCNVSSKSIPVGLINRSKVLIYDNQPGLKNTVIETFNSIPASLLRRTPECRRVYFLLTWYHSVVQQRLRYAPISFTQKYDINDSDFTAGVCVLDKLLQPLQAGKTNVSPDTIPWPEIRYLIGEVTYGGKINSKDDLRYFVELASHIFREEVFEMDFNLIENELTRALGELLRLPEGITLEGYKEWIDQLADKTPLSWVGLKEEVDVLVRAKEGQQVASRTLKVIG